AEFRGKLHQSLAVTRGKRPAGRAQDENMGEFEAFGDVRGHQANRVFVVIRGQRNHAASLAKIIEVLDPLAEFAGFGGFLFFPRGGEAEGRLQDWRSCVETKLLCNQFERSSSFGLSPRDFV